MPTEDSMLYMEVASGKRLHIESPRVEEIDVTDVALGLASEIRFSGQIWTPYTVAQHSVICSRIAYKRAQSTGLPPAGVAVIGLLHDGAEAYFRDICTPLKKALPGYKVLEDRLLNTIYDALLPYKIWIDKDILEKGKALVKEADWSCLGNEARRFLANPSPGKPKVDLSGWGLYPPDVDLDIHNSETEIWSRSVAYIKFLEEYSNRLKEFRRATKD